MKFIKKKGVRLWGAVTVVVVALLVVVNILCLNTFYDIIGLVLGRGLPIYEEGSAAMYESAYSYTKAEALAAANEKNVEICEEGFVLLKNENNALPLSSGAKVSVFGKNSVNLSYGGSGSSGFTDVEYTDLYTSLEEAGFETNQTLKSFYENTSQSGSEREANSSDLDSGGNQKIGTAETPWSSYTDAVKSSFDGYDDAAIIVITRIGGEGFDLPRYQGDTSGAVSEDSTYLELDANERELINRVCNSGFEKVIVLFNIPSAMEATFLEDVNYLSCADKIDAALWIGFTGGTGTLAVGEILNGDVNPSGKTVDTWRADLTTDPTFDNFGTGSTDSGTDKYTNGDYYYVDYEEGIYVGYRYYETRGTTDGEDWYSENVVYPFGYGLSYTTFDWTVTDVSASSLSEESFTVTVEVTNTGDVAGKDVVEIYAEAPYYGGKDSSGNVYGIEKSSRVLVGFAKTDTIAKGKTDTVEIEIDPYDFASYDYRDANGNGFYGYELEAGNYNFYVSSDAHTLKQNTQTDDVDVITLNLSTGITYETDPDTGETVGNRYTAEGSVTATDLTGIPDSDDELTTVLSRADWVGTWPAADSSTTREASAEYLADLADTSTNNPIDYDSEYEYPYFNKELYDETDEEYNMTVNDLLPEDTPEVSYLPIVSYDDERWDILISLCSESELTALLSYGAYQTRAVETIGMPATWAGDGPSGLTCFMNSTVFSGTCHYCSEPVMGSTWNVELIEELGETIGEEALVGYNGVPYSAIYAPGVNIHRSMFGGRNAEYFSEDGFITGKMAAAEIRGAQSKGLIMSVKHFAANEQETHRSLSGDCSWLTEQSLREIYLKGFEFAVKDGKTRSVMSSFNRIGTRWTGGDYRLLTEILRDEWGFEGSVICDFNTIPAYMNSRQMAYAGGDLNLATTPVEWYQSGSTGDAVVLQQCAKNIIYTFVNSNAMKGVVIGYTTPTWEIILKVVDVVIPVVLVCWGVFVLFIRKPKEKKKKEN